MSGEDWFDLMRAKLEAAKREHRDVLNREIFNSVGAGHAVFEPLLRSERWRIARRRVSAYLGTLWLALRGRTLVEEREVR